MMNIQFITSGNWDQLPLSNCKPIHKETDHYSRHTTLGGLSGFTVVITGISEKKPTLNNVTSVEIMK